MKLCYVAGKNVRLHAIVRYVCSSLRFILYTPSECTCLVVVRPKIDCCLLTGLILMEKCFISLVK